MKTRLLLLGLATAIIGVTASEANAASIIKVDLWDKGTNATMATDLGYPATDAQRAAATMGIKLSSATAKPGIVSFQVTNDSKETIHEMVLARLTHPGQPLPFDKKDDVVFENKIAYLGEVEETDPGKTGTLTKALTPGQYILMCNVAGHYEAGMWTVLTVTQ